MCADARPSGAFLKAGAKYRYIGHGAHPPLGTMPVHPSDYDENAAYSHLQLAASSPLRAQLCGASAGASVALRTSEERLRQLFMLSLVVLGGRSFVGAVGNLRTMWLARLKR